MSAPVYDRVALIGLGLIASSMAHAMRRAGLAGEITGHARSAETRAVAREIGLVDRVCETAAEARRVPIWWCSACPWVRWAPWPRRSRRC